MMKLRSWKDLPNDMQTEEVREYYQILSNKKRSLVIKRIFDVMLAIILLILLSPIMLLISVLIVLNSSGGVLFRQERVTTYGKKFYIHKFRTMVADADRKGTQITILGDLRITRIGKILRKYRLDELPQLIDVLFGDMSFVGARPEVPKYVARYTNEMKATLLLPAGITSQASILYKEEAILMDKAENVDIIYLDKILPQKMKYNLEAIKKFSFLRECKIMLDTIFALL